MMAEVTTDKTINAYQLALAHPDVPFRSVKRTDGTTIRTDAVTQAQLERAIAQHEADPSVVPPVPDPEPTAEDRLAAVEARLDAVAAKADEAAVTAQELAEAARERTPGR